MQVSLRDITVRDNMNVNMAVWFRWTEINLFFKFILYLYILRALIHPIRPVTEKRM
jgi:hypothetical protein